MKQRPGYGNDEIPHEDTYGDYRERWVQINGKNGQTYYGFFKEINGENIILSPFLDYVPHLGTENTLLKIVSRKGFTADVPLEAISRMAHSDLRWLEKLCIGRNKEKSSESKKA